MRATGLATMLPVALLLFACVETAPTATPALSFSTEEELRAALVEIDRRCREEYEATIAGLTVSGIAFGGPAASIGQDGGPECGAGEAGQLPRRVRPGARRSRRPGPVRRSRRE